MRTLKIFLILIVSQSVFSQVSTQSPYSYFGIGENVENISISSAAMGGTSISLIKTHEINRKNPALLQNLDFTSFDIGSKTQFLFLSDIEQTQNSSNTSLSYISLGFPLHDKIGLLVGLQPNSAVGYNIFNNEYEGDEIVESTSYYGEGGSNKFFIGTGIEVYKGLSVGIKGEFIFGKIQNNILNSRAEATQLFTHYKIENQLHGVAFNTGVAYQKKFDKEIVLDLDLSLDLKNKITTESEEYFYNFYYDSGQNEIPQDTLLNNTGIKGYINRPIGIHGGIGIGKPEKWYTSVEFNTQKAWDLNDVSLLNPKMRYTDRNSINIGGYYLPKKNSISTYWDRVVYRIGFKYEQPGIAVNPLLTENDFEKINNFGISFGLGLPIGNQLSKLNVSMEYGKIGEKSGGLIQENYFNLRLGLNLVEKWFQKNKIN